LDSHRLKLARCVEETCDANDRIELQEGKRGGRIIEVHGTVSETLPKGCGERVQIHFQPNSECGSGTHARTNSAQFGACDGLMKPEGATPESLIAKSIEAESAASLIEHSAGVPVDCIVCTLSIFLV
jgi:hypothetical protein